MSAPQTSAAPAAAVAAAVPKTTETAPEKLQAVQLEALVVMKIAKHCSTAFPSIATGCLLGLDLDGNLDISNTFAYPLLDHSHADSHSNESGSSLAASAPRQKSILGYRNEMIKTMKEVHIDANCVGWYTSAAMGNFITPAFVENQYFYQKENAKAVALVHDVSRSSQGTLKLRAFQLSSTFMATHQAGKFTTEHLKTNKFTSKDLFVEYPVIIRNSHLLTSFLHQIPRAPVALGEEPPYSVAEIRAHQTDAPIYPSIDNLELSIDPFLEKTCDLLIDSLEAHNTDINNFQYYQRQLGREQSKITQWQAKRKAENASRAASKQPLLPEDEWQKLFKLPQEPSRLDGLLNAKQVDQYARQLDSFTASTTAKMFAVRDNLLPKA